MFLFDAYFAYLFQTERTRIFKIHSELTEFTNCFNHCHHKKRGFVCLFEKRGLFVLFEKRGLFVLFEKRGLFVFFEKRVKKILFQRKQKLRDYFVRKINETHRSLKKMNICVVSGLFNLLLIGCLLSVAIMQVKFEPNVENPVLEHNNEEYTLLVKQNVIEYINDLILINSKRGLTTTCYSNSDRDWILFLKDYYQKKGFHVISVVYESWLDFGEGHELCIQIDLFNPS